MMSSVLVLTVLTLLYLPVGKMAGAQMLNASHLQTHGYPGWLNSLITPSKRATVFHDGVAGPVRSATADRDTDHTAHRDTDHTGHRDTDRTAHRHTDYTAHRDTDHTAQNDVKHQPPSSISLIITDSQMGQEDHQQGLPLLIRTGSRITRAAAGKQLVDTARGHMLGGRLKERVRSEHNHSPFPVATARSAQGRNADPREEKNSGPGVAGVKADLSLMKLINTQRGLDKPLDEDAMNSFVQGLDVGDARQNLVSTWLLNGVLAHTPRSRRSSPLYPPVLYLPQHVQPHHPRFLKKRLRVLTAPRVPTALALPNRRQPDQAPSPTSVGGYRRPSHLKRLEVISSSLGDLAPTRRLNAPTSKGSPAEVSSIERLRKCMQMTAVPSCGSSCRSADQLLEGIILCFLSQTDLQASGRFDGFGFMKGDEAPDAAYSPFGISATAPDSDDPLWQADD